MPDFSEGRFVISTATRSRVNARFPGGRAPTIFEIECLLLLLRGPLPDTIYAAVTTTSLNLRLDIAKSRLKHLPPRHISRWSSKWMDYFTSNSKGVTVIPPMLLPLTDFFSFYFQPSLSAPDFVFACIYGIPESNLLIAFPAKESCLVGLYSKKPAPYTPWLHIFTRAGDQFLIASSLAVAVARRALILKLMFNQTSIQLYARRFEVGYV